MKLSRRVKPPALTEMPAHPSEVSWVDSSRRARTSRSKMCGDRTLWSTTRDGGYIHWDGLLNFIGAHGRKTLRLSTDKES